MPVKQKEDEAGEDRDRIQTQMRLDFYEGVEGGETIR